MNESMYPEVSDSGDLTSAIAARAERLGVLWATGRVAAGRSAPGTVIHTDYGEVRIGLGADERCFYLSVWRAGAEWVWGGTADLDEVVWFADAWHRGASLREIGERWPFMEYDRMSEARERGAAVDVAWELLMQDPLADYVRGAVDAAAARIELRQLFPWLGWHSTRLNFSRCTGYPYSIDVPYIKAGPDTYEVHVFQPETGDVLLGRFLRDHAADAVAAVVAAMPAGVGPAVEGTIRDLPELAE